VRAILGGYRIGKHYRVVIREDGFDCECDAKAVLAGAEAGDPAGAVARCEAHMKAIAGKIGRLRERIGRGRLQGADEIGVRVGKVVNKYKVAKHFTLDIREGAFDFGIDRNKVGAEAALDGIYVVRTSLPDTRMDAEQAVRSYKMLANVERAFRSFKTVDLMVRPIRHRLENRVRAHIFLCMLAYYVQWHMSEVWRPLLYADEDNRAKDSRDPVAPAVRSEQALEKIHTKLLPDGSRARSLRDLFKHLGAIVRNTCRCPGAGPDSPTFSMDTNPDATQKRAFDLLKTISV
jgi:hypothetical protein